MKNQVTEKHYSEPVSKNRFKSVKKESVSNNSLFKTGDALARAVSQEKKRRENRSGGKPIRFWMKPDSEAEVIILDNSLDFGFYEHNLIDPQTGKWGNTECCVQETEVCPLCEAGSNPYMVLFLTVIDTKEYVTKKGQKIPFTKKLFPVKVGNTMNTIQKIAKQFKGLRGIKLSLSRSGKQNSPSVGDTILPIEKISEDELKELYNTKEIKSNEGKLLYPAGYYLVPFKYMELFKPLSAAELRDLYGGNVPLGSKDSSDSNLPF